MNDEELFQRQKVWTAFINKPIDKEAVDDLMSGLKYERIDYMGEATGTHKNDAAWHTITLRDYKEVNKLRTVLLLDNYQVTLRVTEGKRAYLDVYDGG